MRFLQSPLLTVLLCASSAAGLHAQKSWLARYEERVDATMDAQPHWIGPLVTSTPKVEEELRTDYTRQRNAQGFDTWNLGTSKGFQFVPLPRTQITFIPPPFIDHTAPRQRDGFGDVSFQLKYRVFGQNEQHRNYIVTAALNASVPTGKNGNGSCCALLTPLLEVGKGWGRFDVVSAGSGTLPVTNAKGPGESVAWNSVGQYHLTGGKGFQLWTEVESNTTFFEGGNNDGKAQSFVLPGLALRRITLSHRPMIAGKRPTVTFSGGEQIAVTHFHTYDHALILTMHLPF